MHTSNTEKFSALSIATGALLGSTMLTSVPAALAQEAQEVQEDYASDEIIITAQKREENLQDVPIAVVALGTQKLNELQVADFDDYARYLPSVSYQTTGPGGSNVYFRGVASGENANHSTSLPSVGTYLDEQPVTTIQGALDIHIYDIARVEALAGPQGTLYGASSQAGTIRIITNRPDTSGFYGAADAEINFVNDGREGYVFESFVNVPVSENVAMRVVGWYDRDAGYIDNVPGTLVFPTSGIAIGNGGFVEDDYNDVETYGARAALKIDLNENWTILPSLLGQMQKSDGFFAQESGLPPLKAQQFNPENINDKWFQAALTIEGKIGNWDMTYAGAYLKRKVHSKSDYSDYAYFYDAISGYGAYFYDNNGDLVSPNQRILSNDRYTKQSHELRFASPADKSLRFIGGLFYQIQKHNIEQNYIIDNIADNLTIPGTDSNIWLTRQLRTDRDYAAFGELSFDITDKLTTTGGIRVYKYKNSLEGFFGFNNTGDPDNPGYSTNPDYLCQGPPIVDGSPCTNVDKTTSDTDWVHKLNATYKFTDDALVYATWSRGFRPGGINRRGSLPPYDADELDNYELGWKTTWGDGTFRWNGAIYQENWTNMQLSFLGANGLTEVRNAGDARIRGFETDLFVRPADGLTFSAGFSINDANSTTDFCLFANPEFDCTIPGPDTDDDGIPDDNELLAPSGTRLPITAQVKGNVQTRYEFPVGSLEGHVQGTVLFESDRTTDLRLVERAIIGDLDAYETVDVSVGIKSDGWSAEFYVRNLFNKIGEVSRTIQCNESICGDPDGVTAIGPKIYTFVSQPQTVGLRFGTKF